MRRYMPEISVGIMASGSGQPGNVSTGNLVIRCRQGDKEHAYTRDCQLLDSLLEVDFPLSLQEDQERMVLPV